MTGQRRRRARMGLVRSHAPTAGQAQPSRRSLDEATLLVLDTSATAPPRGNLAVTHQQVLTVCEGGRISVAEVAALLQMPQAVVRVVAASLADSGHVVTINPVVHTDTNTEADIRLLERIRDGLRAL